MCGSGSQTSTSQSQPNPAVQQAYTNLIGRATNVANQPLQQYQGNLVAPFNQTQNQAFNEIGNAQGAANPYINAAANYAQAGAQPINAEQMNNWQATEGAGMGYLASGANTNIGAAAEPWMAGAANWGNAAGQATGVSQPYVNTALNYASNADTLNQGMVNSGIGAANAGAMGALGSAAGAVGAAGTNVWGQEPQWNNQAIQKYMSPYTQDVVNTTQAEFNNQNQQQQQGVIGNAISSGAWGGDRASVAQALTAEQQQLAQAPVIAGLENQGYTNAQSEFNTQQQLQGSLQSQQAALEAQTGLGAANAALGAGQLGENAAMTGAGLGAQYGLAQAQLGAQTALGGAGTLGSEYLSGTQQGLGASEANAQLAQQAAAQQAQNQMQAGSVNLGEYNTQQQAGIGAQEASGWLNENTGYAMGNLGNEALNTALTGSSAEMQAGGLQQQLAQEQLNIPYEQYLQQQAYPFQTTGWLGSLVEGVGSGMGGTSSTTTPGPSTGSQLAGLGTAGLGVAGLLGLLNTGGRVGGARGPRIGRDAGGLIPDVSVSYVPTPSAFHGSGPPAPPHPTSANQGNTGLGSTLSMASTLNKAGAFGSYDGTDARANGSSFMQDLGNTFGLNGSGIGPVNEAFGTGEYAMPASSVAGAGAGDITDLGGLTSGLSDVSWLGDLGFNEGGRAGLAIGGTSTGAGDPDMGYRMYQLPWYAKLGVSAVPGLSTLGSLYNTAANVYNTSANSDALSGMNMPLSFGQKLGGYLGLNGYNGTGPEAVTNYLNNSDNPTANLNNAEGTPLGNKLFNISTPGGILSGNNDSGSNSFGLTGNIDPIPPVSVTSLGEPGSTDGGSTNIAIGGPPAPGTPATPTGGGEGSKGQQNGPANGGPFVQNVFGDPGQTGSHISFPTGPGLGDNSGLGDSGAGMGDLGGGGGGGQASDGGGGGGGSHVDEAEWRGGRLHRAMGGAGMQLIGGQGPESGIPATNTAPNAPVSAGFGAIQRPPIMQGNPGIYGGMQAQPGAIASPMRQPAPPMSTGQPMMQQPQAPRPMQAQVPQMSTGQPAPLSSANQYMMNNLLGPQMAAQHPPMQQMQGTPPQMSTGQPFMPQMPARPITGQMNQNQPMMPQQPPMMPGGNYGHGPMQRFGGTMQGNPGIYRGEQPVQGNPIQAAPPTAPANQWPVARGGVMQGNPGVYGGGNSWPPGGGGWGGFGASTGGAISPDDMGSGFWRGGFDGGGMIQSAGASGAGDPQQMGSPIASGQMSQLMQMSPEQLQELAMRSGPGNPQGQLVARALQMKRMGGAGGQNASPPGNPMTGIQAPMAVPAQGAWTGGRTNFDDGGSAGDNQTPDDAAPKNASSDKNGATLGDASNKPWSSDGELNQPPQTGLGDLSPPAAFGGKPVTPGGGNIPASAIGAPAAFNPTPQPSLAGNVPSALNPTGGSEQPPYPGANPEPVDIVGNHPTGKDLSEDAPGADEIARNPWMALVTAGLGMAAGNSPHALQNVATGALQGVGYLEQQQKAEQQRNAQAIEKKYKEAQIQNWANEFSLHGLDLAERTRHNTADETTAAKNAESTAAERAEQARHNLADEGIQGQRARTEAANAARGDWIVSGNTVDPTGKTVSVMTNRYTGEQKFGNPVTPTAGEEYTQQLWSRPDPSDATKTQNGILYTRKTPTGSPEDTKFVPMEGAAVAKPTADSIAHLSPESIDMYAERGIVGDPSVDHDISMRDIGDRVAVQNAVTQKMHQYGLTPGDIAQRQQTFKPAMVAFATGQEGQAVRAFNVGISHLDTARELANALQNGEVSKINSAKQAFEREFGSPAPTNFDAAAHVVGSEIVKAVTGARGALGDRDTVSATIDKGLSPEALNGTVDTYQKLMAGQLAGLKQQYVGNTGANDFETRLLSPRSREVMQKVGSGQPGTQGRAAQHETPPMPGAQKAPDGNWYVPDPNRPTKYLKVEQ